MSLRQYIRASLEEGKVTASPEYMKKEKVRSALQELIEGQVASGDIASDDDLKDFFKTLDMAAKALSNVPFKGFVKKRAA